MTTIRTTTTEISGNKRVVTWFDLPKISETAKRNGWANGFKKVIEFNGTVTTTFYYTSGEYDEVMKHVYKSTFKIN